MESLATVALSAVLMTPVIGLVGAARCVWEGVDGDASRQLAVDATIRHLTQQLHDSLALVSLASTANTTQLTILTEQGTLRWIHNVRDQVVLFGVVGEEALLASTISRCTFTLVGSDGLTPVADLALAESVVCRVECQMPNRADPYALTRRVWLRRLPQAPSTGAAIATGGTT
ncbi:MAG: hypothetical protein KDB14_06470 [Planctomycetales bacterium]|nr:hypothetical protein [Planctomycetales bacterium]